MLNTSVKFRSNYKSTSPTLHTVSVLQGWCMPYSRLPPRHNYSPLRGINARDKQPVTQPWALPSSFTWMPCVGLINHLEGVIPLVVQFLSQGFWWMSSRTFFWAMPFPPPLKFPVVCQHTGFYVLKYSNNKWRNMQRKNYEKTIIRLKVIIFRNSLMMNNLGEYIRIHEHRNVRLMQVTEVRYISRINWTNLAII